MPDFHSSQEPLPSVHDAPFSATALCASRIRLQALVLASTSRFIPQRPFTLYKGVIAVYFLFWCVRWPLADFDAIFLFVTYWAWYAGALYFTVSTVTACLHTDPQTTRPDLGRAPSWRADVSAGNGGAAPSGDRSCTSTCRSTLLCVQMFSWNVSCLGSLVVAVIFWTSLYDGSPLSSVDVNAHLFLGGIMLVDQLLVASPFRMRDLWKTEVFALTYLAFNICHYYIEPDGSKLIYSILDWGKRPGVAVAYSLVTLLVLIPLFALVHYGLFRLRERIYAAFQNTVASSPRQLSDRLLSAEEAGRQRHSRAPQAAQTGTRYVDV